MTYDSISLHWVDRELQISINIYKNIYKCKLIQIPKFQPTRSGLLILSTVQKVTVKYLHERHSCLRHTMKLSWILRKT